MPTPLHLLILEDSEADAALMLYELRRADFAPTWVRVDRLQDFVAQLSNPFDVILADYHLGGFNAGDAIQILKSRQLNIPLIVVSGLIREEVAVECIKNGAADYLLKDRLTRLGSAIHSALQAQQLREEKRKAEAELRESEARLRRLTENAPDIIYRYQIHPSPHYEYISPAVTAILGYSPEEHYADPALATKIVHPDDRLELEQWVARNYQPQILTLRWIHKTGRMVWLENRSVPVYDDHQQLIAIEGVARDITEYKQAEATLQKNEARYRAIVEDQTELICRFWPDGTLTFVNSAFCRYFEVELQQVIGASFLQLISSEAHPLILQHLASLNRQRPVTVLEHPILIRGQERFLQWTKRALFDAQGNFVEFQSVGRDITERKRSDQALQMARDELELRVEERTAQLRQVNEQLSLEIEIRSAAQEALHQRYHQLQTIYQLADAIRRSVAIEEVYEAALNGLQNTLDGECAGIVMFEADRRIRFQTWRGFSERCQQEFAGYFSNSLDRQCRQPLLLSNLETILLTANAPSLWQILWQEGIFSVGFIPILYQGRLLGKIIVSYRYPHEFKDEEIQLTQTIASHIAFATERKQAEIALQESEQQFRQFAENIREVFWMISPSDSRMIYVSPAYEEIWGRSCESLYQRPLDWIDAVHPEDKENVQDFEEKHKQESAQIEYRIILPDGSIRWIWDRSFPIYNEAGEIYRVAGIAEDITQRKKSIAELHKALEKEKELNELKTRFVSMVSHEFRNPLSSIVISTRLLETYSDQVTAEKRRDYLARIRAAAKQMTDLLEHVLVIGRVESGKLDFSPKPLDLDALCRELVEDCQLSAGNLHIISFVKQHPQDDTFFQRGMCPCLDEKLLWHILSNLLSNAIKYSPQGGTVHLVLFYQKDAVIVQVKDEGIGIPPADQLQLFESFHRARNVGKIPGTGLGLAIVKKAVDLHGGTISVHSEVGVGTTFTVRLPVEYY
jgi:PAS domain S-box-containing protein